MTKIQLREKLREAGLTDFVLIILEPKKFEMLVWLFMMSNSNWEILDDQCYWPGGEVNGVDIPEFGLHNKDGLYDWDGNPMEYNEE